MNKDLPTLSITIMAHPKREEWARELGDELDAEVIWDQKNNLWDTCKRAWLANDLEKDYSMVLQDDVILCDNFIQEARKMIGDDYIYSMYSGDFRALTRQLKVQYEKHDRNYRLTDFIYNEIALCMRSEHVEDMVEWCDQFNPDNDHEINRWTARNNFKVYHPRVSLVDHRDEESLYHGNKDDWEESERKALFFKDDVEQT